MPHKKKPNILFIFTDQQRPDWFGDHPDVPVRTPTLDQLSRRGVRFTRAITPSPVCGPARACIATGLEYDRCRVWGNETRYPEGVATYHYGLRCAGYHVMGTGKHHVGHNEEGSPARFAWGREGNTLRRQWDFDDCIFNAGKNQTLILSSFHNGRPQDPYAKFLADRGLLKFHMEDYQRRNREGVWTATFPTLLPDDAYFDNWITRNALEVLGRAPGDRPWYLEVNLQNPHHPWDITESMHQWYRNPPVNFPAPVHSDLGVSPSTHQEVRRNYAAMLEHLDQCVAAILDRVSQRRELENTLIVFSSDHGEMLGDYGQWQKLSPLQASVGVPLIVAGPGIAKRGRCDLPVTLLDIHATFLDWAGAEIPSDIDSRSMKRLLAGEIDRHREVVFSGLSAWRLAFDGRYKLVRGYDPSKRRSDDFEPMEMPQDETERLQRQRPQLLMDIEGDERQNHCATHPEIVGRLGRELDHLLR